MDKDTVLEEIQPPAAEEITPGVQEDDKETLTTKIEKAIDAKEEALEEFQEIEEEEVLQDEIVETKSKYLGTITALLFVSVGAFLVFGMNKKEQNIDKTVVGG